MVKNANFRGLRRIWEFLPTLRGIMNLRAAEATSIASLAINIESCKHVLHKN